MEFSQNKNISEVFGIGAEFYKTNMQASICVFLMKIQKKAQSKVEFLLRFFQFCAIKSYFQS